MTTQGTPVLVLGAGPIGTAFAAAFAAAGAQVTVVEPDAGRRAALPLRLAEAREAMARAGRASKERPVQAIPDAASGVVAAAALVLECGPERLEAKRAIFAGLLPHATDGAVLATASSAITMSAILPEAGEQARCLVAHPVNPPSVMRLIELVPAPGTRPATTARAAALFERAGFRPVVLGREVEGFVLNRLQGAVLREAYRLVAEGVVGPEELDLVVREGLGPRWALSGPFETADLNTPGGVVAHAARMGPAYARMGRERGETDVEWPADLVARVAEARRRALPEERLSEGAAWRARAVAELLVVRDRLLNDAENLEEPRDG